MKIAKLVTAIVLSASLGFAAQAQEETPVEIKDLPSEAQTTIKEKAGTIKFCGSQRRLARARNATTRL
jgi:hypothetical protein